MKSIPTLAFAAAMAASAGATPVLLEVDSALSSVEVGISIAGGVLGDTDSSSLSGFLRIELDSVSAAGQSGLHAFRLVVDDDLHLQDSVFLVGGFTATINDAVFYFVPPPPAPASIGPAGEVAFADVNSAAEGTAAYTVTGAACTLLGGQPCTDTIDLADSDPSQIESFQGVFTIENGIVTFTATLSMTMPLDPDNPSNGTLSVDGVVVARGVACAVDITGSASPSSPSYLVPDGVVDAEDFFAFLGLFAAGDPRADISGSSSLASQDYLVPDGVIDAEDFFTFLSLFAAGCP